jgi:hypothetical protein
MAITNADITFDPTTMFSNNPTKRENHKDKVRNAAPAGAVRATIV